MHKQECNYIQVHKVSLQRSLVWGDGPGDGPKSETTICMSVQVKIEALKRIQYDYAS